MKQLIIAIIFFSFWGGILGIGWLVVREPAPIPTPPPRIAQPLRVDETHIVRTEDGKADVIGMIINPNTDAGAKRVLYEFRFLENGEVIERVEGETYILPSLPSYVVAFGLELPVGDIDIELDVEQPEWRFVESDFITPSVVRIAEQTDTIPANPDLGRPQLFETKGLLANESSYGYQNVDVIAVGRDVTGDIVGFGTTFIGELLAGERREATVQWPTLSRREVHTITWFANVNVFAPDAVILVPGQSDPGIVPQS